MIYKLTYLLVIVLYEVGLCNCLIYYSLILVILRPVGLELVARRIFYVEYKTCNAELLNIYVPKNI